MDRIFSSCLSHCLTEEQYVKRGKKNVLFRRLGGGLLMGCGVCYYNNQTLIRESYIIFS